MNAEARESLKWHKMKNRDKEAVSAAEMLCAIEDDYPCACARFLSRNNLKDPVWMLYAGKKHDPKALIINSKSTLLPVFNSGKFLPSPKFLNNFFQLKKIHSIQGMKKEVIFLEEEIKQFGRNISDFFDYDLMSVDSRNREQRSIGNDQIPGLVLRVPVMTDLDALAPLQAAYEHEEVLHKGAVFSPAASRMNLSQIISGGRILAADLNGRLVGKINVSGISFTKYLIGGVFVHPDFRGKGIARVMTDQFVSSLQREGKGVTLFVKKSNISAQKLYLGLGFKVKSDYRITYF